MSEKRTVVLSELSEKAGETNGRAWTKYGFKDANGEIYSTFDRTVVADAFDKLGQRFDIEFEVDGKFKNLKSLAPAAAPGKGEGETDWDLIGLRKTRCALWVSFIEGDLASRIVQSAPEGIDKMDLLLRLGTRIVVHAERDIFGRPEGDDGIPFEARE